MLTLSAADRNLHEFVVLRYVLIVAVSYLVISQSAGGTVSPTAALTVAAALGSNVLLGSLRPKRLSAVQIIGIVVLLDTVGLSISLALVGHVSTEFFFLYFFVLFFAALSESLVLMLIGVVAASAAYLWVLAQLRPGSVWTQEHLLQVTCLFSAALFYGVLVNRTRQRRREAELIEAADRERTQLLATVAHDIGGPAHVISFGAETLEQAIDGPKTQVRPLLASIVRNSRYLKQLTERFVEYSSARAGRWELAPTPLAFAAVVERVAAQHELDARVTLALAIAPIPTALLDELALVRILSNLIANAVRYSADGGTVAIEAALEGDTIRFAVRDSGPGMAPERCSTVGQPFVAAADARSGSGLGLFIVRSLVEAQGGSMTAASDLGRGTAITIRLPFVPAAEAHAAR